MNIRLVFSGLAACATLCAMPPTAGAKIFPMIFVTAAGGGVTGAASPFGGSGTIDESIDLGPPQLLFHSLAMPIDIAVSDDIIYCVIGGKGIISAFLPSGHVNDIANVPKGRPVGIAAFGGNVFVANSLTNTINEYTKSGGPPVASFHQGVSHPTEITASGGNLFVVNHGTGKIAEYITEYNAATRQKMPGNVIQSLHDPIQIAVSGTDLFLMDLSTHTIDELDLTTHQLTKGFITDLNGPTDIAAFDGDLFVTDVPNHSIDVYAIATKQIVRQITGLRGPQGIAVTAPDASSTWILLLLSIAVIFGFRVALRPPA